MRTTVEDYYTSSDGIIVRNSEEYQPNAHIRFLGETQSQMTSFYQSIFIFNGKGKVVFDSRSGISYPLALEERVEELIKEYKGGISLFLWTVKNRYPAQADIHMLSMVGKNVYEQPHVQEILMAGNASGHIKDKDKGIDVVYQSTNYPGFYVIVQSNYSGGFLDAMRLLPISLLVLDFIVSIVLIYILCKRLFRPLDEVTAHMRGDFEREYNIKKIYDDVQFLEEYYQVTKNYVHKLHVQNEKNLIIKSLLQDTWNQEMQRFLVDKKLVAKEKPYCVAILQINIDESILQEKIDLCLKRRADVEIIINKHMNAYVKYTCMELGLRKLLLIISESDYVTDKDNVLREMENIKKAVYDALNIQVHYAVSDMQKKLNCDCLYKQAKECLEAQFVNEKDELQADKQEKIRMEAHGNQEMLEQVVDYLNNNYQDCDISVSSLAERFHINSSYLGKLFQAFTGKSILSYLLDIRMKRAKDLLMTCPDMSVSQVAKEVGFGSNAYFTTSFRKYYGVSPSKIWDFNIEEAWKE